MYHTPENFSVFKPGLQGWQTQHYRALPGRGVPISPQGPKRLQLVRELIHTQTLQI